MIIEKIYFEVESRDGKDYLLPGCITSMLLLKLIGGKFFTANDLSILRQIGFKFEAR